MKQAYKEHGIAVFAFLLLSVLMTLPVVLHMNSRVVGSGGDPWQTMWRFEAKETSGISGFFTDIFGVGEARLANLSVWPWMPIHLLFGQPLAYNIIWILHFVLAGYAMAFLVKILTNQTSILNPASLLSGTLYMFMPYHIAHSLGHFGAMQLEWIPFIAIAAITFFRSPRLLSAGILGILLTIQAWTEHHYIVWVALFGVIAGLVYRKELKQRFSHPLQLPLEKGERTSTPPLFKGRLGGVRTSVMLLLLIIIFGIIFPYVPTIKLALTNSDALELGTVQTIRFSADLFSYIVPPLFHPMWGTVFHSFFGQYFTGNEAESVQYLGITSILAILFFHKHIPVKQKRLWVITIIFFGLMSLGPVLHVFGNVINIPLPYALIDELPVFSAIRVIARAAVMVSFATAVLFGWVLATNAHRKGVSYAIGALILAEFVFFPFPMQSAALSPVYGEVASLPGSAIIEIPAATNYTAASRSLFASLKHNKNIIGNIALERGEDRAVYDVARSTPSIRQLLYLRTTDLSEMRKEFFNQDLSETLPDAMRYLDVSSIIIHTDSVSDLQLRSVTEFLEAKGDFEKKSFNDALLYTVNVSKKQNTDGVFMVRGDGWTGVGYDPKKESVFAEILGEATLKFVNLNSYPVSIALDFEIAPEARGQLEVQDAFTVPPGEYVVAFRHTGEGKSIIKNPSFSVIPLR